MRELEEENLSLRKKVEERFGLEGLVGKSPQMIKIYDLIETVSQTDTTVLIYGESGTGKEVVANAIHLQKPEKEGSFYQGELCRPSGDLARNASSSVTKRVLLPGRSNRERDGLRWRMEGLSFSMKSGISLRRSR